jgi:hypothetical protein
MNFYKFLYYMINTKYAHLSCVCARACVRVRPAAAHQQVTAVPGGSRNVKINITNIKTRRPQEQTTFSSKWNYGVSTWDKWFQIITIRKIPGNILFMNPYSTTSRRYRKFCFASTCEKLHYINNDTSACVATAGVHYFAPLPRARCIQQPV